MGLWAGGGGGHLAAVLVPRDDRLGDPLGLAVEGDGLVLGDGHGGRLLGDVRRPVGP